MERWGRRCSARFTRREGAECDLRSRKAHLESNPTELMKLAVAIPDCADAFTTAISGPAQRSGNQSSKQGRSKNHTRGHSQAAQTQRRPQKRSDSQGEAHVHGVRYRRGGGGSAEGVVLLIANNQVAMRLTNGGDASTVMIVYTHISRKYGKASEIKEGGGDAPPIIEP